jgi:hypothetical protein
MCIQHIYFSVITFGLSSCLASTGQIETQLRQTNPDWNITSSSFTNAPYWLMPTNVPFQLYPLVSGQWVWTTNMRAFWEGGINTGVDDVKKRHVKLQQQQRMDEFDPPGIANVLEYQARGWNEKHMWNTNVVENWWGIWVEDTNSGWRVNLCPVKSNAIDEAIIIKIGSPVTNSGMGLLPSPDAKYVKLELSDAHGKIVSTRKGSAAKLYELRYSTMSGAGGTRLIVNKHPPSDDDASVEKDYPDTISDLEYPRWHILGGPGGRFVHFAGFVSNGPPCQIGYINFRDIFSIKTEGDYTFIVQPVLFRMHYDGGTFQGFLDRVDLPCATTRVHLVPK